MEKPEYKIGQVIKWRHEYCGDFFLRILEIDKVKQEIGTIDLFNDCFTTIGLNDENITLMCKFVKGDQITCAVGYGRIFVQYRPHLTEPFECVSRAFQEEYEKGEAYKVCHCDIAKFI